jgi:UPF0271 protein
VNVGAHPGLANRSDFGRSPTSLTGDELELLLLQQVGVVERLAEAAGARLHHVKLHGARYHGSETNERLARRFLAVAKRWWPQAILFARAGGMVERLARETGIHVWAEVFVDRAYRGDGSLVPRGEPGATLNRMVDVSRRLDALRERGEIESVSGRRLRLPARTVCVHSDTPGAIRIARMAAALLRS